MNCHTSWIGKKEIKIKRSCVNSKSNNSWQNYWYKEKTSNDKLTRNPLYPQSIYLIKCRPGLPVCTKTVENLKTDKCVPRWNVMLFCKYRKEMFSISDRVYLKRIDNKRKQINFVYMEKGVIYFLSVKGRLKYWKICNTCSPVMITGRIEKWLLMKRWASFLYNLTHACE